MVYVMQLNSGNFSSYIVEVTGKCAAAKKKTYIYRCWCDLFLESVAMCLVSFKPA